MYICDGSVLASEPGCEPEFDHHRALGARNEFHSAREQHSMGRRGAMCCSHLALLSVLAAAILPVLKACVTSVTTKRDRRC